MCLDPKELIGLDNDTSYSEKTSEILSSAAESVIGAPKIREGSNDQLVLDGTGIVGDIVTAFTGTGAVKGGGKFLARHAGQIGEATMSLKSWFMREVIGHIDDAARVVAAGADDAARIAAGTAEDAVSYLGKPITRGGVLTMKTAPVVAVAGVAAIEVTTGGAVSEAMADAAVHTIKGLIATGIINEHNLEGAISTVGFIGELTDALDKSAQNGVVNGILTVGDPNSPDTIKHAQEAALGWLMKPDNAMSIFAAHAIRERLVDDTIPDRDQADRYLADKLIDDIVDKAYCHALGDNQVTREDVKAYIQAAYADPNNPLGVALRGSRLEHGLKEIWPDLDTAPAVAEAAPAPEAAPPADAPKDQGLMGQLAGFGERWKGHLDDLADNMKGITGLAWLAPVVGLISTLLGMIVDMFKGDDVTVQTDNPERLAALGKTVGQDGAVVPAVDHDGQERDPVVVAPGAGTPAPAPEAVPVPG